MQKGNRQKRGKKRVRVSPTNTLGYQPSYGPPSRGLSTTVKYFDTYLTPTSSTTTVGYSDLSLVPQGSAQSQRAADTIWVTKIEVRLTVVASTGDVTNQLRMSIFGWLPNTASLTPGSQSIFENPATTGVQSALNFEGRRDYRIYWDKVFDLVGTSTVPTDKYQRVCNFNIKCKHRIDFNLGATTGYNKLYMANYSDSAVAPHPSYTYNLRIWYVDP